MFRAFILSVLLSCPAVAAPWVIKSDRWSAADEQAYAAFIEHLWASDCTTVHDCLAGPANPLRAGDPKDLAFSADCADLVYMLRAYFAWKKGLPFGFVDLVEPRENEPGINPKYTVGGNRAVHRNEVTASHAPSSIRQLLKAIRDSVSTANFRIDPRIAQPLLPDFYSPAITREALRPGSAIYNGDGHVVLVAHIDDDGRIHFIDAHPDMSVTRGIFNAQFQPGDPAQGAGFHAWRPVQQEHGVLAYALNDQISTYAMEQYEQAEAKADDDFVAFTRQRLAKGRARYDVLEEARLGFDDLCAQLQSRAQAVAEAAERGLFRQSRPGRLEGVSPDEKGIWFAYSTPGRDHRLRRAAFHLAAYLKDLMQRHAAGDTTVVYKGASISRDVSAIAASALAACHVTYRNSRSDPVTLTMDEVMQRLFDLSFDPYACPERRWGARGPELETCAEDPGKAAWYQAQAPLRSLNLPVKMPRNPTREELAPLEIQPQPPPDFPVNP